MPEFTTADQLHILLGFAPGVLLGLLIGFWYEHAARFVRPDLFPPRRAGVRHPVAPAPQPLVAPVLPRAVAEVARDLLGQGNARPPACTEQHANAPQASGLNAYGEVINPNE